MKKTQKTIDLSPVPNNPRDNELYVDKKEKGQESNFNRDNMLFDATKRRFLSSLRKSSVEGRYGGYRTAAGDWKDRDEPDHAEQDRQADAINKMMHRRKAAAGRDRLKAQNKVPTRDSTGKKLFEQFCREAYKERKKDIDDLDMSNIFNAAQYLSYKQWIWFVNDEYSSRI